MRWDVAAMEAVLERIWDLHDSLSDGIVVFSRTHYAATAPLCLCPMERVRVLQGPIGCVFFKGRSERGRMWRMAAVHPWP
jgi:hypothetical protein